MKKKSNKTILFVCAADVSTSQNFIDLVGRLNHYDIWVFNSLRQEHYTPQQWKYKTISLFRPRNPNANNFFFLAIPDIKILRIIFYYLNKKLSLLPFFLKIIIHIINPKIIHSIALPPEGLITYNALKNNRSKNRPKWIVSSWSSDIFWDRFRSNTKGNVISILSNCDGFIVDNQRDLTIAKTLGLREQVPTAIIPGGGGISTNIIFHKENIVEDNIVILFPKGYDSIWHKPYVTIEALFRVFQRLQNIKNIEIIVIDSNEDFRIWCSLYGDTFYNKIKFSKLLSQNDYFETLKKADILLAPSLTDGTPNSLLEAMAMDVFPIFSAHESIKEWIEHCENGLLVNPLDASDIAENVFSAIVNPNLRRKACNINRKIILERAIRTIQEEKIKNFYEKFSDFL